MNFDTQPAVRSYDDTAESYEHADGRTEYIKALYPGNQGNEGVWLLVTEAVREMVADDASDGDLFRAILDNDTFDSGMTHGTEVIAETRGELKPLVLGYVLDRAQCKHDDREAILDARRANES